MQKINPIFGLPSTDPSEMTLKQKVEIQTITEILKTNFRLSKPKIQVCDKLIAENIYIEYITFSTQELEDEYLAITATEYVAPVEYQEATETTEEVLAVEEVLAGTELENKNRFLSTLTLGTDYTLTMDLHPNVKLLYTTQEETDLIIELCKINKRYLEILNILPSDFFDSIGRLSNI